MKKIYLLFIIPIMFLWACEKKSEDVSEIVEVPKITLNGDATVYLKAAVITGLTQEELGYKEEGAKSSQGKLTIVNNLPKNNIKPGVYYVKYIAISPSGIRTEKSRKIIVYEDDGVLSGIYTAKLTGWRGHQYPNEEQPGEIEVVISTANIASDGSKTYKCADLYASFWHLFLDGKYWNNGGSISPSEDIKIDASGNITGTGAYFFAIGNSTAIFNGKKIDDDNLLWWTARPDGSIWVKLELTKKKFN